MTCLKDTAERGKKSSLKIVVTRGDQVQRIADAAVSMVEHEVIATRANTARIAKRFWISPKSLELAMRILAEEDLNA